MKSSGFTNILFDLDGTLCNPKEGIVNSYMYSVRKLGLTEDNPNSIADFIGSPLHLYFETVHNLDREQLDKAIKYYREYYSVTGQFENVLYDGVPDLLNSVIIQNRNLYLVTSKPSVFAESILNYFAIRRFFSNIYGSDLSNYNSTKTELIRKAIDNENLNAETCIMIGDRMHDIIGAKDNNVASIAVTYGFGTNEEFRKYPPTITTDSVAGIAHSLSKLENKKGER